MRGSKITIRPTFTMTKQRSSFDKVVNPKDLVTDGFLVGTRVGNIWVFSPLVPSKREKVLVLLSQFCSVCIFSEGSVFTFQFLNDKMHNHVIF